MPHVERWLGDCPLDSSGRFSLPEEWALPPLRPLGYLTWVLAGLLRLRARRLRLTRRRGGWLRIESDSPLDLKEPALALGLRAAPRFRQRTAGLEVAMPEGGLDPLLERYRWADCEIWWEGRCLTRPIHLPDCLLLRTFGESRAQCESLWRQRHPASFSGLLGLGRRVYTGFPPQPSLRMVLDGLLVERDVDFGFAHAQAVLSDERLCRSADGLDVCEDFAYQRLLDEVGQQFQEMAADLKRLAVSSAHAALAAPILEP